MHIFYFYQRNFILLLFGLICSVACHAEVVVVVNPQNPIQTLKVDEVRDIFLGQSSEFPGGDLAIPADLPEGATRDAFYMKVADKSPQQMRAYWLKLIYTGKGIPPQKSSDSAALKKLISKNQGVIGYIDEKDIDNSVKVVPIK